MSELLFLIEESDEGGFIAKGLGISIYTEAETLEQLQEMVKDAIRCHFDDQQPRVVRFHYVKELVFAA
ncbi:MAG: hypothetical protein SH856_12490 [Flavobacteriales bacterium]|nr:hypothetical protein [Flavobacteriales bacterium]